MMNINDPVRESVNELFCQDLMVSGQDDEINLPGLEKFYLFLLLIDFIMMLDIKLGKRDGKIFRHTPGIRMIGKQKYNIAKKLSCLMTV